MSKPPIVFMFSGQGSHHFNMGRSLYEGDPMFRNQMLQLDTVVRQTAGYSVLEALYDRSRGRSEPFDDVRLSHPAIFMIEYALAQTLMAARIVPAIILGASLGSIAAAAVAGYVRAEEALRVVIRQADILHGSCRHGTMLAIFHNPDIQEDPALRDNCEIAAVNLSNHFVVSVRQEGIAAVELFLQRKGILFQRLPVSIPFHSRWIDAARPTLESCASAVTTAVSAIPIVCCSSGLMVSTLSKAFFWNAIRAPIRFGEAISNLEAEGDYRYIDVGPSGTLAGFLKHTLGSEPRSTARAVFSPFGRDLEALERIRADPTLLAGEG